MTQMTLRFAAGETPIHRERDRPKAVSITGWNRFLDDVCVRQGVSMTHEQMIAILHAAAPHFRHIRTLSDFGAPALMAIETYIGRIPWIGVKQ